LPLGGHDIAKNLALFISQIFKEIQCIVARLCSHWRVLLLRDWFLVVHLHLGFDDIFHFELKKQVNIQKIHRLSLNLSHVYETCVAPFHMCTL